MVERSETFVSEDFDPTASPPLDKDEMEKLGDRLFAAQAQDILERQIAYLPASYDSDQYLIYFPSIGMKWLEMKGGFDGYQGTVDYLLSQLPLNVAKSGVTIVINGRNVQTNVSRQLLERVASSFPIPVREVHLMIAAGLFGFKKTVVSESVAAQLHLVYTYDQMGVTRHLRPLDLPVECGGRLEYDHHQWLLHKLAEERMLFYFDQTMAQVKRSISPLKERLEVHCYDDVEQLLLQHLNQKEAIINEINETRDIVKKFLCYLERGDVVSTTMATTQQHVAMVTQLKTFVARLDEEEGKFNVFWVHHKAVLDHKVYLGYFLRSVEKTKSLLEGHLSDLSSPDPQLPTDLQSALDHGQKHEAFVTKLKQTIDDNLRRLQDEGKQLREPLTIPGSSEVLDNPYQQESAEMVEAKLRGLAHQYQVVMNKCQQKRDLCIQCVNYHIGAQECEKWWTAASDFLSEDLLQETSTEAVSVAIGSVDGQLESYPEASVSSLKKIAKHIPDKILKKGGSRHVSKCHKYKEKLESKRTALLKALAMSFQAPPPPPTPPPPPMSPTETSAHRPFSSPDSLDSSSVRSEEQQDGPCTRVMVDQAARARRFVYDELVATETDYIRDLKAVIQGYYEEMAPENNRVPVRLRGKRQVIFGNLYRIYKFHDQTFLTELKRHADDPAQAGAAFLEHGEGFELYEDYCKNRPNSEEVLQELREVEQMFFHEIQTSLGHQLPLASYLLKPVQRITKYQLLLKDLIKHTSDGGLDAARDSQVLALERMLNILRYLNNSMKVIGLRGFPGSLVDQGRLLIQDVFQVAELSKQGRLFPRTSRRHVFLFEKVVVFSKLQEVASSQQDGRRGGQDGRRVSQEGRRAQKEAYFYKAHIPMSDLSLRDAVDGQPLEFQLTLHSQNKSFKLVATSLDIKTTWTAEVSRLLQEQLSQAKNLASRSHPEVRQPAGDTQTGLSIEKIDGKLRASIRKKKKKSPPPIPNFSGNGALPTSPGEEQEPVVGDSHMLRSHSVNSFDTDEDMANMEDNIYETLAPGAVKDYVAISNYHSGAAENDIGLVEGQQVEVVGVNQYGWWWVRASDYDEQLVEGWVPAGYLQPIASTS